MLTAGKTLYFCSAGSKCFLLVLTQTRGGPYPAQDYAVLLIITVSVMFRWQLLAVVVSSACIKPAVGWQIPASSRKTFLFWIPSVMGPLSLHGVSVFLFQSHIHFLMGNSHLCLFLASDLFILQMVLCGPAAKRFLGPSAAEVDSEQELFKGHVGPPTFLLASGHIISLLLASHFLLLLSSCLENNVFCASCPWLC